MQCFWYCTIGAVSEVKRTTNLLYSANDYDNDDNATNNLCSTVILVTIRNRELYLCHDNIIYILFRLCKLFSQRNNTFEHDFNLGLDINGKHGEFVIVKLDNFKGCVQNYSIVASAFIREIKITGHLRPKLI